ncbi:hypothetical protein Glove_410g86 [Diversispora epigaea]|uniref:RanBD1 domain-containing protein n=2 Tax=Diversispora epigaea TaxID=1348612 RepID=A0A397GZK6_9GLOM|nr:hypothetical protein Glove_410g86 [Diversispora epigaea]
MNSKISSSEVSNLHSSKGVFGSRSKYAGNSLMESFASMLDSKKSIFDEQPTQNEEEDNKNDKDTVEEEVPLEAGTNTLLQEIEVFTGEENETAQHSTRAKLFCMDGKTWKERGVGILKLNYPISNERSPRIVMWADNVLKVILNVALFHGMHIERSQEKFIRLFAFEGDQLVHLAIKLPNINAADGLFKAITDAIPSAENQSHLVVSEESKGKKRKVEDLEDGDDDENDGPGG